MLSQKCTYSKKNHGVTENIEMVNFVLHVLNNKNKIVSTRDWRSFIKLCLVN